MPGTNDSGRWVEAADLKLGDRLWNDDGSASEVVGVRVVAEPLEAYNLEVAEAHTFFIRGAANDNAPAVWVHNCGMDDLFGTLSGINRSEFDELAGKWGSGTFDKLSDSMRYHANKHFDGDVTKMLRSAGNFSTRGTTRMAVDNGATKYTKNGWFQIRSSDGKILSHGRID